MVSQSYPGVNPRVARVSTALAPGHQTYLTEVTSPGLPDQRTARVPLAGVLTRGPGTEHAVCDEPATTVGLVTLRVGDAGHVDCPQSVRLRPARLEGPEARDGGGEAGRGEVRRGQTDRLDLHPPLEWLAESEQGQVVVVVQTVVGRVESHLTHLLPHLPVTELVVVVPGHHHHLPHLPPPHTVRGCEDSPTAEDGAATERSPRARPREPDLPGELVLQRLLSPHYLAQHVGQAAPAALPGH